VCEYVDEVVIVVVVVVVVVVVIGCGGRSGKWKEAMYV
jgi:hypothetical protein